MILQPPEKNARRLLMLPVQNAKEKFSFVRVETWVIFFL